MATGDARHGTPVAGEAVGLIHDILPAADILTRLSAEAARRLTLLQGAIPCSTRS
jgi:nitronate monooxygenase